MAGLEKEVSLQEVVPAELILDRIGRGEPIEYDGIIVEGDLNLCGLSQIFTKARKESSVGLRCPDDSVAISISTIRITNSEIRGVTSFGKTIFVEDVDFSGTAFCCRADFSESEFCGYSEFMDCRFDDTVEFSRSKLSERADFSGSKFSGDAYFIESQFSRDADFRGVVFSGDAYFMGSQFGEYADFSEARFGEYASFRGSTFRGYAYFSESMFSGDASFCSAHFNRDASFMGTQFYMDASFTGSVFGGYASFMGSHFREHASFQESEFKGQVYLTEAKFEDLKLPWNAVKDHLVCDGAVSLALVKVYKDMEWFSEADDCYYRFRLKSQSQKSWSDRSKYLDYVADLTCGYGIRPFRTFNVSFWLIMIFAVIFWMGNTHISLLDAVYHSSLAFLSDAKSFGTEGPYKYLCIIERLLGWLLMSLFLVTLGKVMIR
jgi:uncharacterized protein YjbI with pentapeptide repeats